MDRLGLFPPAGPAPAAPVPARSLLIGLLAVALLACDEVPLRSSSGDRGPGTLEAGPDRGPGEGPAPLDGAPLDGAPVDAAPTDAPPTPAADLSAAPDQGPLAGYEPNGVRQIYPSQTSKAAPWVLGFGSWKTRTRKFGSVSGSGKGTVVAASGQVRMNVMATTTYCEGITDQGQALKQGYMCSAKDWYNYEITGYLQLDSAAGSSSDQDWSFYGGGGRHTGGGPPTGCKGSAYKGAYHYKDAEVRVAKESWHVNYDFRPWKKVSGGVDYTKNKSAWLGMKVIRYEFSRKGDKGLRNEIWLDLGGVNASGEPANLWKLVVVEEDHPDAKSWGEKAKQCGCPTDDQIMFWGGPWVTFRWDSTAAKIRLMSVREIVPPSQVPAP